MSALTVQNWDAVSDEISKDLNGSITISNESLKDNKHNLQYRTTWALKDAEEKVLTASSIDAAFDSYGEWDDGEAGLQKLGRQIYAEAIANIMADQKIAQNRKEDAKNAIVMREDRI